MIIWDLLAKFKSTLQVYTHHKYMLWWCFKNPSYNAFASEVLLSWVKFCVDVKQNLRHYAMKTVVSLLCSCHNAKQTFVLLFDTSSSNNQALIKFLKEAYDFEVSGETNKENFQNMITLIIHHLHSFLVKLFVMKNGTDKDLDKILCQDLDCLLWCHKQTENVEVDTKNLYHIAKYCFLNNSSTVDPVIACIKFLQFTLKHERHFEKV